MCLCVFALKVTLWADNGKISMQPECRTFYADREHIFIIKTEGYANKSLSWNLRYAGRTLASGKRNIPLDGKVKITFKFPKLNEGVIAATEFNCWVGKKVSGRQNGKGTKENTEKINLQISKSQNY